MPSTVPSTVLPADSPTGLRAVLSPGLARAERAALLDLLTSVGPAAPTLCPGWTTHELAAHLVVRERQPLAVPGYVVAALHPPAAWLEARAQGRAYEDLLAALRTGPPLWSPLGSPLTPVYDATNLHEFFIHHEDVRRACGLGPRPLGAALEQALWTRLRVLTPVFLRRVQGGRVTLETPGARTLTTGRGDRSAVVRGQVGELFLWAWGRPAEITVTGDTALLDDVRIGP